MTAEPSQQGGPVFPKHFHFPNPKLLFSRNNGSIMDFGNATDYQAKVNFPLWFSKNITKFYSIECKL